MALPSSLAPIEFERRSGRDWDEYVAAVRAQMDTQCRLGVASLRSGESLRRIQKALGDGAFVAKTEGTGLTVTPRGTIHDWTGAIYLADVTPRQVFTQLNESSEPLGSARVGASWSTRSGYIVRASYVE